MSSFKCSYLSNICLGNYKIFRLILPTLLILIISCANVNAEKSDKIKIASFRWDSHLVGSRIVGELMKMVGEKVEYYSSNPSLALEKMAEGEIDVSHAIWESHFYEDYKKALATGGVEEIGFHNTYTREDWWYPDYVEKICPGLPNWVALAKCSSKFSHSYSGNKGVFISGPISWEKYNKEKIEAFNMNFVIKNVSSAEALWIELDKAVEQKIPIVIYNWSPNFIGQKYAGKFIEFPKYNSKCITDASWGLNPDATHDCGNPTNGRIKIAVNKDFKKNYPKGYKVIKEINFSLEDFEKMSSYILIDKMDVEGAAIKWINDNNEKWFKWIN